MALILADYFRNPNEMRHYGVFAICFCDGIKVAYSLLQIKKV